MVAVEVPPLLLVGFGAVLFGIGLMTTLRPERQANALATVWGTFFCLEEDAPGRRSSVFLLLARVSGVIIMGAGVGFVATGIY